MLLQRANTDVGSHRVMRAGFWRLSAVGASSLSGCCSLLLVTHALGPVLFGQYAFALWLAATTAAIGGSGIAAPNSRSIADMHSRAKPEVAAGIFLFVLRLRSPKLAWYCLLYVLLVLPCIWFFGANASFPLLLLALLSMLPRLLGGIASFPLRALRRFDLLAAIQLLGAALALLLILLSLQSVATDINLVYLFLLATAVAGMLALSASLLCIGKLLPLKQVRQPGADVKQQVTRELRNLPVPALLDTITWQHAELIALGRARPADLGFYMLCTIISACIMRALPTLYITCILPARLRWMPFRYSFNTADAYRRTTLGLAWLVIPVCALGIAFCSTLVGWCFGAAYLPVVMPLRILLVAAMIGSISSVSVTRLAHDERKRAQTWLSAVSAALTLTLALPLIALAGMTGAAIASAIAQCVCATGTMFICIRNMRARKGS